MSAITLAVVILAAAPESRIAVLPTQFEDSASSEIPAKVFDEALLDALQEATADKIIGADDLQAVLGLERQRDLVGHRMWSRH